ncbi:MAG: universal stress protein [Thermoanaerobaculia bacterium]
MRNSQEATSMSGNDGIRRILAPTDFSDSASSAVDYAKLLAKRFGAGITLLHAAPPVATFEPLPLEAIALVGTLADERDRASTALESYREKHLSEISETDVVLATASPAEAILSSSRALNADIIVMGTHGREGLSRALLGSVAESVIHQSDRPVLIVRPIATRPRSARFRRILCPVNYSAVASRAYDHALFLASAFDAELTVLYLQEYDWADDATELKRLRQWVGDVPLTVRATLLVDRGEAATQVNEYALAHEIDLIVIGVQHKRRDTVTVIGSTTAKLTRHAPCPVLTIPADLLPIEEPTRELDPRGDEHATREPVDAA